MSVNRAFFMRTSGSRPGAAAGHLERGPGRLAIDGVAPVEIRQLPS